MRLVDVGWLVGEWRHAHSDERVEIVQLGPARYELRPLKAESSLKRAELTVFETECRRFAQWKGDQGDPSTAYALVSGHHYRLSMDVLPAIFPDAWKDSRLLAAIGTPEAPEVRPDDRVRALDWLAAQIDTEGTFMHQDCTFFRPTD